MQEKKLKNAYRDPESNAVINIDADAYRSARARKQLAQKQKSREARIDALEEQFIQMKESFEGKLNMIISAIYEQKGSKLP